MEMKKIEIEIRNNENLSTEEISERMKVLSYDIVFVLAQEKLETVAQCEKIITLFAEVLDIMKITEKREKE